MPFVLSQTFGLPVIIGVDQGFDVSGFQPVGTTPIKTIKSDQSDDIKKS